MRFSVILHTKLDERLGNGSRVGSLKFLQFLLSVITENVSFAHIL
jgi:hypothetical protein